MIISKIKYFFYKLRGGELDYYDWYLTPHTDISFTREYDVTDIIKNILPKEEIKSLIGLN
jgi:hypothetical protein